MDDINCPYCRSGQEINHDDGYGYAEDEIYKQECYDCGKIFAYKTSISFLYEASKVDCLNGDPHKYVPTNAYPRKYTWMKCEDCGHNRPCTDEEMKEILANEKYEWTRG